MEDVRKQGSGMGMGMGMGTGTGPRACTKIERDVRMGAEQGLGQGDEGWRRRRREV